jgi:hypothetical protein
MPVVSSSYECKHTGAAAVAAAAVATEQPCTLPMEMTHSSTICCLVFCILRCVIHYRLVAHCLSCSAMRCCQMLLISAETYVKRYVYIHTPHAYTDTSMYTSLYVQDSDIPVQHVAQYSYSTTYNYSVVARTRVSMHCAHLASHISACGGTVCPCNSFP